LKARFAEGQYKQKVMGKVFTKIISEPYMTAGVWDNHKKKTP
jgi:hypothetical protein